MPEPTLNFFDTYTLIAVHEENAPEHHFFRDRYFPTGAGDIFASDKVLTEYRKGDRRMAAFVAPRIGDIPVDRIGYQIHEYEPAYIGLSRALTADDLTKRGFGEALYANSTPAQRAARLQADDLAFLERRIARREEWMAVQTMINNACTMQEYIDASTPGEQKYVAFYDSVSDHTYTVESGKEWNTNSGDIFGDVRAMCAKLFKRGLPAADLVLGQDAGDVFLADEKVQKMLDKNLAITVSSGLEEKIEYPGVVRVGVMNFHGFNLTVFVVSESYEADNGTETLFFPAEAAMVTAPACGHLMYGQITQIDYGKTEFSTYAAKRVPKFLLDQENDVRKLRLATRPLAAPKNYCPYIYCASVLDTE